MLSHVRPADAGIYVCKCKTDEGDLYTTSYELEIITRESHDDDLHKPKIVYAAVGSTANLPCENHSGQESGYDDEEVSYRWSRQYGQMQLGADVLSVSLTCS